MSFRKTSISIFALLLISVFSLVGCGSSAVKQRKEQRDKMAQASKLYCEFVNGEIYANDIDVALNIEMAKRCDAEKPFTVSQYKTPSESQGLIYCCSMAARSRKDIPAGANPVAAPAKDGKKEDPKKPDAAAEEVDE
jgi:hypothetical protein